MSGIKTGVTGSGRDRAHKRQGAAWRCLAVALGMTAGAAGRRKPGRGNGSGGHAGAGDGAGRRRGRDRGQRLVHRAQRRRRRQAAAVAARDSAIGLGDHAPAHRDQNMGSLEDAMAQTPGITIDLAATAAIPQFYSRGFQIEYFQYDGVPCRRRRVVGAARPVHVRPRRALRGAAGLFNGAGQPGGVINLVRGPARVPVLGSASAGSWDNYRGELDLSSPLNARVRCVAASPRRRRTASISTTSPTRRSRPTTASSRPTWRGHAADRGRQLSAARLAALHDAHAALS